MQVNTITFKIYYYIFKNKTIDFNESNELLFIVENINNRFKKKKTMKKIVFLILFIIITQALARTVNQYVIHKPGEVLPTMRKRYIRPNETEPEFIDEDVKAQMLFKKFKEIELEGRIPYQESRKTTVIPTYTH